MYNRLYESIHKKCNEFRKREYLYWIRIGCWLDPKNDSWLKIIAKIIANIISKYGIDKGYIRPEQYGFRNREECISPYTTLRIICQRRKFDIWYI